MAANHTIIPSNNDSYFIQFYNSFQEFSVYLLTHPGDFLGLFLGISIPLIAIGTYAAYHMVKDLDQNQTAFKLKRRKMLAKKASNKANGRNYEAVEEINNLQSRLKAAAAKRKAG
jgi:hypothetical protein